MTPIQRDDYRVGVDAAKKCKPILNSDDVRFGGNGNEIPAEIKPVKGECDGKPYSIGFSLPPFTSAVFQI
jgi:1,4-alpha-glucan branching enzyme